MVYPERGYNDIELSWDTPARDPRLVYLGVGLGVAALGGILWYVVRGRARSPLRPGTNQNQAAEWIARVLLAETGLRASPAELAGIASVAVNRANKWNTTIQDVVLGRVRGHSVWNNSAQFHAAVASAPRRANWRQAYAFAQKVVSGAVRSPIGPERIMFVHPKTQRALGRQMPSWAISRSQGGTARTEPLMVGNALFS